MTRPSTVFAAFLLGVGVCQAGVQEVSIIPEPVQCIRKPGGFRLRADTRIVVPKGSERLGERLRCYLSPATGYLFPISNQQRSNAIVLKLDATLKSLGPEGYHMAVTAKSVEISAFQPNGLLYGAQTLRQLLPAAIFRQAPVRGVVFEVPALEIEDYPRFQWRGGHLDVGRHFMPKEFVLKYIDLLALHKMNVFHFHLTEDQGWRIEIRKYPKLTEVSAWRKDSMLTPRPPTFEGRPHGGFYTQEELREIVAYAQERFVTVVPEIEMPGHAQAAIASYPGLGNTADPVEVWTSWGVSENIYNVAGSTISFLQDVLAEVLDIFPGPFIHIGGDEVPKKQWKESRQAQERMKELGLQSEEELQSWFIKQADDFLTARGRRLVGWDEILEGGLAPGATVMSWRGEKGGIEAARLGHDVVMTPTDFTYFDYYQSQNKETEPPAGGGVVTLEKVYGYDPLPAALSADEARHVLGAQFQVWTEYIPTPKHAEYMAYPRACALSEVVWSPKGERDFDRFLGRLAVHLERLKILDVNYRKAGK